jgi:CRISPR-associated protein Csx17
MKIKLEGCKTEPFSSYLKALAILRLIGEQKDPETKGWWEDDLFIIETNLSREEIINFFLNEYQPTPIASPWNHGSYFYLKNIIDNDPDENVKAWLQTTDDKIRHRFESYINTWERLKEISSRYNINKDLKELKPYIILDCRNKLDEKFNEWIDTAVLVDSNTNLRYPPILTTGGNEGNQDYSNTFLENINMMLIQNNKLKSQNLLKNSLFNEPVSDLEFIKIAKFDPGHSGGYNQGVGIEQKDFLSNPWDFIFLLEGTILWSSAITRRFGVNTSSLHSSFSVSPSPVEFGINAKKEHEIWAPVWANPIGIQELKAFFKEGRSEIGRKSARTGLEFAESVTLLGVDRGITKFVRYNLKLRRGKQYYIAIPSGHYKVKVQNELDIIKELNPTLNMLNSFLQKFNPSPPSVLTSARRGIDESIFMLLNYGGAQEFKNVLSSIGKFEKLIARRDLDKDPKLSKPIIALSPKWLTMANDGSIEFRIAVAAASIIKTEGVGAIRANLEPVNPENSSEWKSDKNQVAWIGKSLYEKMSNVLIKRMMDADRLSLQNNPLSSLIKLDINDIAYFINESIDEEMVENLIFGLTWINWNSTEKDKQILKLMDQWNKKTTSIPIPRSWALLKLLFLPEPLYVSNGKEIEIKYEPSILPLLASGRINEACKIAKRRLYICDLNPINIEYPNDKNGLRIAAALLLPIKDIEYIKRLVLDLNKDN